MRGIVLTVLIGIIIEHRRSAEATEIICPPAQTCSTSVMNVTCSIKNFGLAWKASSFGYTELFTGNDPAGTIETEGPFTAVLNHSTPAKSSLFITPDPSMEGLVVKCIDGITADSKSCLLSVITLPGKPINLTVTHITDTSVSLKWHPPKHTGGSDIQIIRYEITVSIETAHDTNETLTQELNGNETSATISGLQNGTIHNFTIHAYNCLGEAGNSTPTLTVTPGKSMIQVYPAEPSKQFISNSSVEVYWNTSAHSADSAVKDYILHITKNGTDKEELQTGSTNQTYYFSNLLRGIEYFLTVAAVDTDNRVGKMSDPIHVLLDVPRKVDYLDCSITRTQNEFGVYTFFLEVQSMHSVSILPPVEKFKISHNVTETGNFISIVVAVNSTIINYKTEVHLNNLNGAFLVLISAINTFGEGEAALTDIQADSLTAPNNESSIYNDISLPVNSSESTYHSSMASSLFLLLSSPEPKQSYTQADISDQSIVFSRFYSSLVISELLHSTNTVPLAPEVNWHVLVSTMVLSTMALLVIILILIVSLCRLRSKAKIIKTDVEGVADSNLKQNPCYATIVRSNKDPVLLTYSNPAYESHLIQNLTTIKIRHSCKTMHLDPTICSRNFFPRSEFDEEHQNSYENENIFSCSNIYST